MNKYFSMIEVEVNSNCNRSCSYCPNSKYTRKEEGEMEQKVFIELLKQLQDINFNGRISYHFYGEPLLCSNLENFIKMTKEFLPHTRRVLYSNGDLLTLDKFNKLVEAGVTKFVVTQHEGKISLFKKTYNHLSIELRSMIEYLNYKDLNLTNRGGLIIDNVNNIKQNSCCFIPTTMAVVTVNGNVLPCFEDYNQENIMGNIRNNHIKNIWLSDKYTQFRKQLRDGNRNKNNICCKCNNNSVLDDNQFDFVL